MTITSNYIDFGGSVYFYDAVDHLDNSKENAFIKFVCMTCRSWTFNRMTDVEKKNCISAFQFATRDDKLRGNFLARWDILQSVYEAFLLALGYNGAGWRD